MEEYKPVCVYKNTKVFHGLKRLRTDTFCIRRLLALSKNSPRLALALDLYAIFLKTYRGSKLCVLYEINNSRQIACVFDFDSELKLIQRLEDMTSRDLPFAATQMLLYDVNPQHWYLDSTYVDRTTEHLKPRYKQEIERRPDLAEIPIMRAALIEELCDQETKDMLAQSYNTAEAEEAIAKGVDTEFNACVKEKFEIITGTHADKEVTQLTFEEYMTLDLANKFDTLVFGADGEPVINSCDFTPESLIYPGSGNTRTSGFTYDGEQRTIENKSTHSFLCAAETMGEMASAREYNNCHIMPTTTVSKDERNRAHDKKVKAFQPSSGVEQKETMFFSDHVTPMISGRVDRGYVVGVSNTGREFDTFCRMTLGLAYAEPIMEDNDRLRQVRVIEKDAKSFEYNHHPQNTFLEQESHFSHVSGGCKNSEGKVQPELALLAGSICEANILPEIRPSGGNLVYRLPPYCMMSGGESTLCRNNKKNKNYDVMGLLLYYRNNPKILAKDANAIFAMLRMGDDKEPIATEFSIKLQEVISNQLRPVMYISEAIGPLISEMDEEQHVTNGAIKFCKQQLCLEEGVIILRRAKKYMYKMLAGNTSTIDPYTLHTANISNAISCFGSEMAQNFIRKFDQWLRDTYLEDGEKIINSSGDMELKYPNGMDIKENGQDMTYVRPIPTYDEIKDLLLVEKEDTKKKFVESYLRTQIYNCPVKL